MVFAPVAKAGAKVLIVGGGPVGLITALSLLKNRVSVRLIEKSIAPRIGQRGPGISPRTQEIFESLGFVDEFIKGSIEPPRMRFYKLPGGTEILREIPMGEYIAPTPDRPYTNTRLFGQEVLDKVVRADLENKHGYPIEFGVELRSFEQVGEHVKVTLQKHDGEIEEATYDYVVGADGAKSVIRKQLGLSFLGETTQQKFIVGDFILEGLAADRVHIWGDMGSIMVNARPTETSGFWSVRIGGAQLPDNIDTDEAFKSIINENTGGRDDIKILKTVWRGYYLINIRMVDTYSKGRIFLAGDAGHIHSPTGGQGLNTGVQDAYNLGWKLALVMKGLAPPSLLDTYTEERLPVAAEMLQISTSYLNKVVNFNPVTNSKEDAFRRTAKLQQFGVNYRSSPIVVDDGLDKETASAYPRYGDDTAGPVYAGDRAPDASGLFKLGAASQEPVRLFHLLSPTYHTVLLFADRLGHALQLSHPILSRYPDDIVRFVILVGPGNVLPTTSPLDVYEDRDGHAATSYRVVDGNGGVFVVRPDGYVGARLSGLDRVEDYFKGIFGNFV